MVVNNFFSIKKSQTDTKKKTVLIRKRKVGTIITADTETTVKKGRIECAKNNKGLISDIARKIAATTTTDEERTKQARQKKQDDETLEQSPKLKDNCQSKDEKKIAVMVGGKITDMIDVKVNDQSWANFESKCIGLNESTEMLEHMCLQ